MTDDTDSGCCWTRSFISWRVWRTSVIIGLPRRVVLTQDYRVAIVRSQLCFQASWTWPYAAPRSRTILIGVLGVLVVLVDQFYSTARLHYANFSHFKNISLFCVSAEKQNKFLWIRVVSLWGNCVTGVGYNTLITTSNKYCLHVLTSNNSTVKFKTTGPLDLYVTPDLSWVIAKWRIFCTPRSISQVL